MQILVLALEPEHDKRFYLPTSQCSKSIPPWPGSHWLKETMSLIKTGRGPANMAHPSFFPSRELKEKKRKGGVRKKQQERGERAMCPRSRGIPWIKLSLFSLSLKFPMTPSEQRASGWPSFTASALARLSAPCKSCDLDLAAARTFVTSSVSLSSWTLC